MYAVALLLSGLTTAATTGLPYFHLGSLDLGPVPIQSFGVIVAAGVLIGASLLRRYAEWHGVSDEHVRGLTGWVTVAGFLGAHVFDTLFYEYKRFADEPILILKVWDGISSYGGFLGGAIGFMLYVWWKRLPVRLFADITVVGLLPAFSIGRIGCTVVSDHVGAAADPTAWYSFLAMDYMRDDGLAYHAQTHAPLLDPQGRQVVLNSGIETLFQQNHAQFANPAWNDHLLGWNLGLIEFLYLIPVNLLILWLAFRPSRRLNAGMIAVMTGMFYAPVRFFLDYLRPINSDPRHFGFTFAQWCSIAAFGVAVYAANRIMRTGKVAETVTRTSGEAQAKLKSILRDDDERAKRDKEDVDAEKVRKQKEIEKLKEEQRREDEELAREAEETGKKEQSEEDEKAEDAASEESEETDEEEEEEEEKVEEKAEEEKKPAAAVKPKPSGAQKQKGKGGGGKKKSRKR
jgi:phosphatidylglycerol:prolipoprotein diacylglycerol transferase